MAMNYSGLIRSSALTAYSEMVMELGGEPAPLLNKFSIREQEIGSPLHMVPLASVIDLLEDTSRELDCPDFGLRLAEKQSVNILGPLAIVAMYSSSVSDGLKNISRYIHFHSPVLSLLVDQSEDHLPLYWRLTITLEEPVLRRQFLELALLIMVKVMQLLCGQRWNPVRVKVRHLSGLPAATYRKFFGALVEFSQPFNGLGVRQKDLERSIDQSDKDMCQLMKFFMERFLEEYGGSLTNRVRGIIAEFLGAMPRSTIAVVASQLSLSEQELQVGLKQEGTTFEAQLEDIRRSLVRHYLENGNMSMTDVATAVGYREQSSLNRACKRWFGKSPTDIRRHPSRRG